MGYMKSRKVVSSSTKISGEAPEPMDRLSALLEKFRVRASLFHTGRLCGTQQFEAYPGRAFLHVLRRGSVELRHASGSGLAVRQRISEPTLFLYPAAVKHAIVNAPREGADFTCATLHFDGGSENPFVAALPALVCVPLSQVPGLGPSLELLFAETDHARCGSRVLADRLFEVILIQLLRFIIDQPHTVGVTTGMLAGLADRRLARALVAIHRAPARNWSLPDLAQCAGMSRSAFAATFRAITGVTPAAYLSSFRLTVAMAGLRAGEPVKSLADRLGYAGAASLSRAFRRESGVSPREWLASCQPAA